MYLRFCIHCCQGLVIRKCVCVCVHVLTVELWKGFLDLIGWLDRCVQPCSVSGGSPDTQVDYKIQKPRPPPCPEYDRCHVHTNSISVWNWIWKRKWYWKWKWYFHIVIPSSSVVLGLFVYFSRNTEINCFFTLHVCSFVVRKQKHRRETGVHLKSNIRNLWVTDAWIV
jgi:hypothetical protein